MSEGAEAPDATSADVEAAPAEPELGTPGPPLDHKAPFFVGLVGGLGFALAWWLFGLFCRRKPTRRPRAG